MAAQAVVKEVAQGVERVAVQAVVMEVATAVEQAAVATAAAARVAAQGAVRVVAEMEAVQAEGLEWFHSAFARHMEFLRLRV